MKFKDFQVLSRMRENLELKVLECKYDRFYRSIHRSCDGILQMNYRLSVVCFVSIYT